MAGELSNSAPLLEARGISKSFPGVRALADVSLRLFPGELLAVVGENGAGKSTLMKVLAGVEQPDAGTLLWEGQPVRFPSVHAAEARGVVLIHQELNLAENLDIAGNVFLGREPTWGGPLLRLIDRRRIYAQAAAILGRVGLAVAPRTLVGDLAVGQQQLVEIARALSLQSRVLIMDEPTSSLTERETERLFAVIADLKAAGVSVLYITHRLKEVELLADRVTVLRDGKNAGELDRVNLKPDAMVRLMVGRELKQLHQRRHAFAPLAPVLRGEGPGVRGEAEKNPSPQPSPRSTGARERNREPLLAVENLRWSPAQPAAGVSLTVRAGEIVGLAGLMGAGRTELAETLFGVRPRLGGRVTLAGQPLTARTPAEALAAGLFLVPEDRRLQGLVLSASVRHNVSLASLDRLRRLLGLVALGRERRFAQDLVHRLRVRTPSLNKSVGLLSGGNQQKVVLAKGLGRGPRLLLLDEPTRGVDVGAKAEIYALMDELAGQGVGVLMISSDLEEVLGMSDRVVVLHEGRVAGEVARRDLSEEAVMRLATGG